MSSQPKVGRARRRPGPRPPRARPRRGRWRSWAGPARPRRAGRVGGDRAQRRRRSRGATAPSRSSSTLGPDDEHPGVPAVLAGCEVAPRPRRRPASPRTPRPRRRRRGTAQRRRPGGCSRTPVAGRVGSMPIVTSRPSRATSAASATARSKAVGSAITWSAANEPITASGSWRSSSAAASPIAAIESRGDGSASTRSARPGQLATHRVAVGGAGHHQHPVAGQRREPVDGLLQQRAAAAGEVVQELRRRRRATAATAGCPRHRPGTTAQKCSIAGMGVTLDDPPSDDRRSRRCCPRLLAADPGRPLVTFYDDATGERTELSVTTYANWVAKVASLLADELEVEHGSRLLVDLPAALARPVVLGAAWAVRARGGLGRRGRTPSSPGPTAWPLGREARRHPGARHRAAAARRTVPRRRAAGRARPRRRGVVAARRVRRVARRPRTTTPRSAGTTQRRAVEVGRRRESAHRRRPPPLGGESGFPFRSRLLHRTAGSQRFHGPGHPRLRGEARADRGRRARHRPLRPRSARQVVAPEPAAEVHRRAEARAACPGRA